MKVANTALTPWYSRVLDRDSQNRDEREQHRDPHKKDQDPENPKKEEPEFVVSEEQIQKAIALFAHDQQAQQNGLSACIAGKGPGLRVVLKDAEGHVVRALNPTEFVVLQSESKVTPTEATKGVGKLLDRKV